ncbi:RING-H2 finger protein ATL80-like [Diospyros lotus]|uniref:RING-H2 finger protein ATL80-like n=1 Tax=Diospyros lotus TaxID=55363 RepID=UPI0022594E46|nr:RING-H2 finger protein ATL80-like [Diospyros lotus]
MLGSGMNLITTVIGFGMSATFIVFVCTRLICGRIRGVESRRMFEIDSMIDLEQPEHPNSGLELVVIAAIPTMKFNHEDFSSPEDAQCTICLGEYQEKEELRIMPNCGHNFHLACIDEWLRKQATCPICRLPLQEMKHARSAALGGAHSRHWMLPGAGNSEGHGSSELQPEAASGGQELAAHREAETQQ